ncbi:MAG: hypothetical protein HKO64_02680, partial [Xanthomonadales bacterium]|nr:hypothetical protein [Xanthomonadales bacterium]
MANEDKLIKQEDKLIKYKGQVEAWHTTTEQARVKSERDQDYDDHAQWTPSEQAILEKRKQPPIVINRVKTKVNLLCGIQRRSRTKPKGYPRTPRHTDAADAATEALRYVNDNNF